MLLLCCCSCCCPSSETDERGERGERGVSHTRGWKSKRVRDDDKRRRRRRRRRSGERRRSTRPRDEGRGTAPAFSQPPQAVPLGLSLSRKREKKEEDRVRAQDSVLRCAALPCVRHDHAHGRRRPRRRRAKLGPRCLRCGALTINQLAFPLGGSIDRSVFFFFAEPPPAATRSIFFIFFFSAVSVEIPSWDPPAKNMCGPFP